MQKVTSAITFPHIVSRLYLQFLHFLQKLNHTSSIQSLTSRFKIHETLLINQSNFLNFKNYLTIKAKPLSKADFIHLVALKGLAREQSKPH